MPTLHIEGMSCDHCRRTVTAAIEEQGGKNVVVDVAKGLATWDGSPDIAAAAEAVAELGFTPKP